MLNPLLYLDALDISVWQRRSKPLLAAVVAPPAAAVVVAVEASEASSRQLPAVVAKASPDTRFVSGVDSATLHFSAPPMAEDVLEAPPEYLHIPPEFDVADRFEPLLPEETANFSPKPALNPQQMRAAEIVRLDWLGLQERVRICQDCELHRQRTQTVFGVGAQQAPWLIVGEAPGQEEDVQGEPFVGRAGHLLNAMLQVVGVNRAQVYIANTVKCRPPNNRTPDALEMALCAPYLQRQIQLLQPQLILVVGRVAVQQILHSEEAIGRLRGKVHRYADTGIPVIVSYHPAYLLRRPSEKAKVWLDLQLACRTVAPTKNESS